MFLKRESFLSIYCLKISRKDSYSFSSIMLFCGDCLYKLSNDLIVCLSFSYCFVKLLCFFRTTSYHNLLHNDKLQVIPAGIGTTIKATPVIDNVTVVDVAPMITTLSIDFNFVFRILFIYCFFVDL